MDTPGPSVEVRLGFLHFQNKSSILQVQRPQLNPSPAAATAEH